MGPLWQMSVRGDGDIGDIFLIGQEARFLRLRFAMIWRRTVRGPGSPFFFQKRGDWSVRARTCAGAQALLLPWFVHPRQTLIISLVRERPG